MAKRRGVSENVQEGNKKRSKNTNPMTPTTLASPKPERSMLNDVLLSLYKKDPIDKKDTPAIKNDIAEQKERSILNDGLISLYKKDLIDKKDTPAKKNDIPDQKAKENDAESSKTPARVGRKAKHAVKTATYSTVTLADVGGMDNIVKQVIKIMFRRNNSEFIQENTSAEPKRGILLHGPPGCGKTLFARAIAGELGIPILEVPATELVCGISGESENKIRDTFDAAVASGRCILFIDEIDAICSKREMTDNGMMKRMVSQILISFDELTVKDPNVNVIVIGATNMPDSLDPALRRGSRFEQEWAIGIPNEEARLKILKVICKNKKVNLAPDFDLEWLAHNTPGYVGSDLKSLVLEAIENGFSRVYKELLESSHINKNEEISDPPPSIDGNKSLLKDRTIEDEIAWCKTLVVPKEIAEKFHFTLEDFKAALQICVPSSKREGFASVPEATWDDVGALEDIKEELRSTILWPVKYNKLFKNSNLSSTKGILLYGPKGCGKTLLAKAIANECSINFLSVNGPELLSMYVGESEKAVRKCFERARNSAPCVIFFDEFDALCPPRSSSKENAPIERVVNQLLTETCGLQDRKQVFLVAATNRLEKIDSAMLRPGRLEKVLYVGLPTPAGRVEILKSQTKNKTSPKIEDDLSLETIALDARCNDYSGADLAYLVRAATSKAVKEIIDSSPSQSDLDECQVILYWRHFDEALNIVKPSFSEQDRKYFQRIASNYTGSQ